MVVPHCGTFCSGNRKDNVSYPWQQEGGACLFRRIKVQLKSGPNQDMAQDGCHAKTVSLVRGRRVDGGPGLET